MKTFIATGPLAGVTGTIASWAFVKGMLQLPDQDADAASRILCRYHGCKILETDDMIVSIWGPKDDNEWRQRAQQVARERWPGRSLQVHHPSEWKLIDRAEALKIAGVLVTEGCDHVVQGLYSCGIRPPQIYTIPLNPNVPDPGRTGSEMQEGSRTGTYLADPTEDLKARDEADAAAPTTEAGEETTAAPATEDAETSTETDEQASVAARFLAKEQDDIAGLLKDSAMDDVLTDSFLEAAIALELEAEAPRGGVLELLSLRVGAPVPVVTEQEPIADAPEPEPAEEASKDGDEEVVDISPEQLVRLSVRAFRKQLQDEAFQATLTPEYLEDALAAEKEKAKPRNDILRKLNHRLGSTD